MDLINHPKVSVTPHIGANTIEAQDRIGLIIAEKLVDAFKNI
jgi:D-3-phosphoglycerate dehydrogenase